MPTFQPSEYVERALLACARLVRRKESEWNEEVRSDYRRLRHLLSILYAEIAHAQAAELSDVSADAEYPGYLVNRVDGVQMRVPFHLFDALPAGEMLAEIVGIARTTRSFDESTLCMSGSCAMYDGLGAVTDVDFCEYVSFEPRLRSNFAPTLARVERIDDERLLCFDIHLFETRYDARSETNDVVDSRKARWPWPQPPSQSAELGAIVPRARKAKFNFLADTKAEGLIVVTEIALIVDGLHDHLYLDSHPAQEIPLALSGSIVPRRLHDPLAAGRYVRFLVQEARKALQKGALSKAAKRAYALARILTRERDADRIAETMQAHDVFVDAALGARLDIAREIEKLPSDDRKLRFRRRMRETLEMLCSRGVNAALDELVRKSKHLDDLSGWIKNLEQYMQTRRTRAARIETDLRDFVEEIGTRVGLAGG